MGNKPRDPQYERAAVTKGAALLDRILPGWYKQVKLERLRMGDGAMCMLGQLFGTRAEGKLAREMYPTEIERAREATRDTDGYYVAYPFSEDAAIARIRNKLGITYETVEENKALGYVCDGHDTKCEWAHAVAERLANDAINNEQETT
jgi:hypothetical protein